MGTKRKKSSSYEAKRPQPAFRVSEPGATGMLLGEKLRRLIADFGDNRVASLLGVSPSQPSRWQKGGERISAENQRGLLDLDYVMARLLQLFPHEQTEIWLTSHNALLGARPIDVLRLRGAARVVQAIDVEAQDAYASDSPAGAIAEAFGSHAIGTPQLLQGRQDLSGSVRVLAELDAEGVDVLNLDDPRELVRRRLRPSTVVTRDRTVTQRWALDIFNEKRWAGIRWRSLAEVLSLKVTRLTADHPALIEAAAVLSRPWKEFP